MTYVVTALGFAPVVLWLVFAIVSDRIVRPSRSWTDDERAEYLRRGLER